MVIVWLLIDFISGNFIEKSRDLPCNRPKLKANFTGRVLKMSKKLLLLISYQLVTYKTVQSFWAWFSKHTLISLLDRRVYCRLISMYNQKHSWSYEGGQNYRNYPHENITHLSIYPHDRSYNGTEHVYEAISFLHTKNIRIHLPITELVTRYQYSGYTGIQVPNQA